MEDEREKKQEFLRSEIIDKGYDAEAFSIFLQQIRGGGKAVFF